MSKPLKIDYVADVSCPFCAIGLASLDAAVAALGSDVDVEIHLRPFELNPSMVAEGQDFTSYLTAKGAGPDQIAKSVAAIRERAKDAGIVIELNDAHRIYNTFDAHRLLHWAGLEGRQLRLKRVLYQAYFEKGRNPADHDVLAAAAVEAGLDEKDARMLLGSDMFAEEVRRQESSWRDRNVTSVPAMFIDGRLAVSGGAASGVFEEAIRTAAGSSGSEARI